MGLSKNHRDPEEERERIAAATRCRAAASRCACYLSLGTNLRA